MRTRLATIAAAVALTAGLLGGASRASAGYYKSITIDGDTSDWADVPVAVTDPADFPTGGIDFTGLKVANDGSNLYVLIQFGHPVNPQQGGNGEGTYMAIDSDNNVATGFNIFGRNLVGSEAGYQNEFPFSQKTNSFNSGTQTNAKATTGNFFTVVSEQELSYSLAALDDVGQKVFPNAFSFLYYSTDTADDSGVVHYTLAAVPEPSAAGVLAAGLALPWVRRRRGR